MSNLILFGFHGCGKTSFGKVLASKLNRNFLDTDIILENLHGKKLSCREIFKQHGEKFFRSLETSAIKSIAGVQNSVIALGGGTILQDENYQILKNMGTLIYLEVDKETLKERMLKNGLPAYLSSLDDFDDLYTERKIIYEKYCHQKIFL